ncbi:MAG: argininosuccinate lyase [Balneola sp.]|mgnify:FL=1|jgi:argininosuccinate lyase|nr:argininosuccinate lyase [Balneola sp.]MAO77969.1 argininosuccinate lyase [Balneola sp.]MBF65240.1 argininosuccinate lyase [Balneola sp.]HAW79423.1 argininosuccinate lyase [Balneola sp.]|tara:strand:- start:32922 stop:34220 length:1299 start_codon:yes stop_codon:yes gene_type:complete
MAKKLWEKGIKTDQFIEEFTVGKDRELDLELAKHDVRGTIAHITMLESVGLLEKSELEVLIRELENIQEQIIAKGKFQIEDGVEDVHSQIELMLTKKLGDVGKKIHSGRSRNDQVLVDIRLFLREQLEEIRSLTNDLFSALIDQAGIYKDVLMPGYTHTQAAMPSSFGLWFSAYAESLVDDMEIMNGAYKVVNRNPLGSAAGYGSGFPLNRQMTSDLLGFESMVYNSVYAQMGRGKTELVVASALANLASTLNKLAADVCLYNSQNFQFLKLPDELTTGSSIMPHKKNPDVFELLRAKTNVLMALPNQIMMTLSNLTSGYHRDFQLLKELLFPAIKEIKSCLKIASYFVSKIEPVKDILDDPKYKLIFSVEAVNELVVKGIPFREAYQQVAKQIEDGSFVPPKELNHTHEGSIGNLMLEEIQERMEKVLNIE